MLYVVAYLPGYATPFLSPNKNFKKSVDMEKAECYNSTNLLGRYANRKKVGVNAILF